ncbi:RIP metalloprotease RseP [Flaviaesturariibacter flavus]|uniref:Zinc metalloprotease n=2 Tax=Flaviaesturariibacter flavus TaxID=2502780 RepID=A0A4R1BPN7_9BACT|nr:RIP metalloprotease RseP [Flaviaesturariibacter flavus]
MHLLAIDWAVVGIKAAQLILSFSILVVLHELGHFLPAKWFGCRVEKFYLFFNPGFSIFKKQVGETEYGLGWIPFGGYVKIAGMIDESMDKEQMKLPAQNWEFRSKPAWQRLIIMLGGVTVNVLLAIVIFIGITWKWGEEYLPPQNAIYGLTADSLGRSMGLVDGDVVTKVNGVPVKDELRVTPQIITLEAKHITVLRNGAEQELPVPEGMVRALNSSKGANFASLRVPGVVGDFGKKSNAKEAGLQKGDKLVGVDSVSTPFFQDFQRALRDRRNKTVQVRVDRKGQVLSIPVAVTKDGTIGLALAPLKEIGFRSETRAYSFGEAVPAGIKRCWNTLRMYTTGLKQLFTGKANPNESVGSVFSFASIFPSQWDWQSFWTLTAIFSIILAFMNVLPIPALDGGHALFTIYEMITGRKPGDKFMEYAQMVGMVLLLALMAYALGLDIWRIVKNIF